MDKRAVENLLGSLVSAGLVVTTLIMSPFLSVDVVNVPKIASASVFAAMGIGTLVANRGLWSWAAHKTVVVLVGAFCFWQFVVLFASGANKSQQLFGVNGRNTGLVTYCALAALLLIATFASNERYVRRFSRAALLAGGLSIAYGLLQFIGADPLPWKYIYNPIHGFLGNPDFQSSFVGITCAVAFALIIDKKLSMKNRVMLASFIISGLFVAKKSGSQQGLLVFAIGVGVVGFIYIRTHLSKAFYLGYIALAVVGFIAVLLGSFNKGPLGGILYRSSLANRGDYWRAGWKMTTEHPIFGVGMDSYGNWYRRSRDLVATTRSGADGISDAAHNVFLDYSSNGGFPLLIIYVAITGLVLVSLWKVIARTTLFNPYFAAIAGAWVAYQAQSIISINQIGIAIWGWVLSGLIIGYELHTREKSEVEVAPVKEKGRKAAPAAKISSKTRNALVISLLVGVLVGMPPLVASARFKAAKESGNLEEIIAAGHLFPLERDRMTLVGMVLRDNKFDKEALTILLEASEKFPDSFDTWKALASLTNATPAQVADANAQMKRLDPLNPNLK